MAMTITSAKGNFHIRIISKWRERSRCCRPRHVITTSRTERIILWQDRKNKIGSRLHPKIKVRLSSDLDLSYWFWEQVLIPVVDQIFFREIADELPEEIPPLPMPTDYPPRSWAKIEVMAHRCELGLSIFHPLDAPLLEEEALVPEDGVLNYSTRSKGGGAPIRGIISFDHEPEVKTSMKGTKKIKWKKTGLDDGRPAIVKRVRSLNERIIAQLPMERKRDAVRKRTDRIDKKKLRKTG